VTSASSDLSSRRRRNRSAQRERILAWLRGTDIHPTAAQIHEALSGRNPLGRAPRTGPTGGGRAPRISLGTVYRNLEVLVAEGEVVEVLVAGRPARYDARVAPHHHFCCDVCGAITDVDLPVPRSLARRLAEEHGLAAQRIHVSFHGSCPGCEPGAPPEGSRKTAH
jgi:Fe2+ or Zn2+ uptake regulation protein